MFPLLFALSLQPLMIVLEAKRASGLLIALCIMEQKSLLYQLFFNDARMFLHNTQEEFEQAREAIQAFENIFGVLLNVGKLVIVPLVNPTLQAWFEDIGCQVLKPHETTINLGCLLAFMLLFHKRLIFYWVKS